MNKFKVLAISYGRQLFDTNNKERQRMEACANTVGAYHMIVFTKKTDGLKKVMSPSGLAVYPTNSKNKLLMVYDAYKIGKQILKEQRSEAWVITSQDPFEAGLVGFLLSCRFKIPLNIQEHGDFFSSPYWRRDIVLNRVRYVMGKWLLQRATSVRVVSWRIERTMKALGVEAKRILSLSVRSDEVSELDVEAADLDFDSDVTVVLTMARLEKQKNLPLLIRSFSKVYQMHDNVRLVIIGRGKEEKVLKELVSNLGLNEVVKFIDWTDEPQRFLKAADIYALTSDWEGWARVLVEAMAFGLPLVTTDVGCAGEVVIDGKHGFVVPVRDEAAFTESLNKLVRDTELRQQFAYAAKTDFGAQQSSSVEDYAQSWSQVLQETIELKRG